MSAFIIGAIFGFCCAGWVYGGAIRRARMVTFGGLDVSRAVRRIRAPKDGAR